MHQRVDVLDEAGTAPAPAAGAVLRFVARALRTLAWTSVWTVVVLAVAVTWATRVLPYKSDVIVGHSMEPTIPLWSVTVVEPVPPSAIRVGDVIAFQRPDVPTNRVTHRVEQVNHKPSGLQFVTRGDNNNARDPWIVHYDQNAWRVRAHIPYLGWALVHAQSKLARTALVVIPTVFLLWQFLSWLWKEPEAPEHDRAGAAPGDAAT